MATPFLRTLGQLAGVAGNVVAGANADRQNRLAAALAAKKQADEEARAKITNAIAGKSYDPTRGVVVDLQTETATPIPDLPSVAEKPMAPHTVVTDRGIAEWNPATKKWHLAEMETGPTPPTAPHSGVGSGMVQGPSNTRSTAPSSTVVPMKPPAPKPDLIPVTQNGKTVLVPKTEGLEIPDKDKPTPALMIASMNRLGLAENDISSAIEAMERDENDPAFREELTAVTQALAAAAQTTPDPHPHGVTGAVNNIGGTLIAGQAQKIMQEHPRVATYMRNKRIVGTAATEILPRPNQQLLAIEQGLSGIDVSWNPELIKDVQHRRRMMRDMLHESLQSTPLAGKTGSRTATKGQPGRTVVVNGKTFTLPE